MKLKSYFSGTVESAMELARVELGQDALLVNARPTSPETRSLGAVEVVFGVASPSAPVALTGPEGGNRDFGELRREIGRMSQSLRAMAGVQMVNHVRQPALYAALVENELDPELAQQIADGTPLEEIFEVDATLGRREAERAVVVLVGPPGAGKTTTLVKLAARYALAEGKPAHIVSTDVHRIAAADQLRYLASILGLGCTVVETPTAFVQVLEEHRAKELIFVDTPGLARDEMEDLAELAQAIRSHTECDTHLVLPASMKPMDLHATIERFQVFGPRKLLFTKLDETDRFGALVSESAWYSLPLSFLATGQQIPNDLEPASKESMAALLLQRPAAFRGSTEKLRSAGAAA